MTKEYLAEYITDSKWLDKLYPYFEKHGDELFKKIGERKKLGKKIYPSSEDCFKAFNLCPWDKTKVVILGQDPYHQAGVATGLAFGVKDGNLPQPSLQNILIEVEKDIYNGFSLGALTNYSLEEWAKQGVLLLNTALTVEENDPGSHCNIWKDFTNYVLSLLSVDNSGLVFLLWGAHAKSYKHLINQNSHHILESGHPSPLSANRGFWFGNKHFSKTNNLIRGMNGKSYEIVW